MRTRVVDRYDKFGGKACGSLHEEKVCNPQPCPVNCEVSVWDDYPSFPACSKPCNGGFKKQTRTVTALAAHGGMSCPQLKRQAPCNQHLCPIPCKLTPWFAWSECSKKCAGGIKHRIRKVHTDASYGGKPCSILMAESQQCNTKPCNSKCTNTKWSSWSSCSAKCGGGEQTRTRNVDQVASVGDPCGTLGQKQVCNATPCPVDCKHSSWGVWTDCDKICGGGVQKRIRQIEVKPKNGGKRCGDAEESRACNTKFCPVACIVTPWSKGECSTICGQGKEIKRRKVISQAGFGGTACPKLDKAVACNTNNPCPKDCKVTAWSAYSTCSKVCAGGHRTRTRSVKFAAVGQDSKACPKLKETVKCNVNACPKDCAVSGWKAWAGCNKLCGGGEQTRVRKVVIPTLHGGAMCPPLKQKQRCNNHACPQACVLSAWSRFSKCSSVCGKSGRQSRSRSVKTAASNGGAACGSLHDVKKCNQFPCNIDCEIRDSETKKFAPCDKSMARRIRDERDKCGKESKMFELTNIERGTGKCVVGPKWKALDLKDSGVAAQILTKDQSTEVTATLKASCPLSLHKKSGDGKFGAAKPFAACMTISQKICIRDERSEEKQLNCVHLADTKCKEVCVEARFCGISVVDDVPGELVERKYGWRSPNGKACCYRDCKLPRSWLNSKAGQLEPTVWCNQVQQTSKSR